MHTPELAYVKLRQFPREYAGTGDGLPPGVGKKMHGNVRNVFFRTHELPRMQKAIILLSCSLERPRAIDSQCALLSKKTMRRWLIDVNEMWLDTMVV